MGTNEKLKNSTALAVVPVGPDVLVVDSLDDLAAKIKNDLTRREKGKAEWIDATLDLCQHLAEARARFKAHIDFGRWFDASGIEMNEHDRSAAIALGKKPKRAREILEDTQRRSLQLIHAKEFRFANASKTTTAKPADGKAAQPKKPVTIEGEVVTKSPKRSAINAVDHDNMVALVRIYGSGKDLGGKPFTDNMAANKLGNINRGYVHGLLQRMQNEPVNGYTAFPDGGGEGTKWRLALADIDLTSMSAPDAEPDEAAPAVEAEEPGKPLGRATLPPSGESNPRTPFVIPPGAGPRIKYELRRILKDDDLARRFIGMLAETAHGSDGVAFGVAVTCGQYLMNELGAQENTVEQVLAAYDALEQPVNWMPETEKEHEDA